MLRGARKRRAEEGILRQLWDIQKSKKGGEEEDQEEEEGTEKENRTTLYWWKIRVELQTMLEVVEA